MIIDSLKNSMEAEVLNPYFKKVFDYIRSHDMKNAPVGRIDIDGDNAWINVSEVNGKEKSAAALESHDVYIDIQLPLSAEETFGWEARELLKNEREGGYNAVNDITFYTDAPKFYFSLQPGEFAVFFPQDGHAPCIGQGIIKKIVAKVKVCRG